jgi:hypothetical protein
VKRPAGGEHAVRLVCKAGLGGPGILFRLHDTVKQTKQPSNVFTLWPFPRAWCNRKREGSSDYREALTRRACVAGLRPVATHNSYSVGGIRLAALLFLIQEEFLKFTEDSNRFSNPITIGYSSRVLDESQKQRLRRKKRSSVAMKFDNASDPQRVAQAKSLRIAQALNQRGLCGVPALAARCL